MLQGLFFVSADTKIDQSLLRDGLKPLEWVWGGKQERR